MARTDPRAARASLAKSIASCNGLLASLRTQWRWITRDVPDDRVATIEARLDEIDRLIFELARDVVSGAVDTGLPDAPRPLFDRPAPDLARFNFGVTPPLIGIAEANGKVRAGGESVDPTPTPGTVAPAPRASVQFPPGTRIGFPPGTKLFQCSRCNLLRRPEDGHPCGHCKNPEFGLVVVAADGETLDQGWPVEEKPAKAAKPKRARKLPQRTFDVAYGDGRNKAVPLGQVLAKNLADAVRLAGEAYGGSEVRVYGQIVTIGPDDLIVLGPVTLRPKPKADPVPSADWEDPRGEVDAYLSQREELTLVNVPEPDDSPTLHEYEAHLEDNGDFPTFMGVVTGRNLADAKEAALSKFLDDLVLGTPIRVEPCRDHLGEGGRLVEVAECAACGARWPASDGVVCPTCDHGAAPPELPEMLEPQKPKPKRKPPTKTFLVLYRHDPGLDPIEMEEIKALSFEEAKARLPQIYSGSEVQLPGGRLERIDHDKLVLVQVPAKPRKKKEAAAS